MRLQRRRLHCWLPREQSKGGRGSRDTLIAGIALAQQAQLAMRNLAAWR